MKNKITRIIIVLTIFGIGCCVGKLTNWGYFELNNDISIFEALSLFVTLGCTLYVVKVLEKEQQDKRIEKNMFIGMVDQIEKFIRRIDDALDENSVEFSLITNTYQRANINRNKLFELLGSYNSRLLNDRKFLGLKNELQTSFKNLKPTLTDTPVDQNKNKDISIKNGIATYSQSRKAEIRETLQEITNCLFALKIRLNRY